MGDIFCEGGTKSAMTTGLRPEITKQILLQGAPKDIADAVKVAISVERALTFANGPAVHEQSPAPVHVVEVTKAQDDHGVQKLMEQGLHRLEALESRFTRQEEPQPQLTAQDRRPYRRCYKCGMQGRSYTTELPNKQALRT